VILLETTLKTKITITEALYRHLKQLACKGNSFGFYSNSFFRFISVSPKPITPPPPHTHCIRQVSKRLVSKRLKRQVYKTSVLQNDRFTKCQVYKMSDLQSVRSSKRPVAKKNPYIFCTFGWLKSAGSVAAMFAGKVMAVFYSLF
jgi:hypothetical protein